MPSRRPPVPRLLGWVLAIVLVVALALPAHAAVSCANPTNGVASGSGTSFTTGSITPVSGELAVVAVSSRRTAAPTPAPTLTGTNGLNVTWSQVQCSAADCSLTTGGSTLTRLTVFSGIPSSGTAGTLTPDWAASSQTAATLIYVSCSGVDTATAQGVVQGATGAAASGVLTVTLGAFGSATNATYMAGVARGTPSAFAPEGSFADWDQCDGGCTVNVTDVNGTVAEWLATSDTTPSSTATSGANWAAIGLEIKETTGAAPAVNFFPRRRN